jgi:hypothetical protein
MKTIEAASYTKFLGNFGLILVIRVSGVGFPYSPRDVWNSVPVSAGADNGLCGGVTIQQRFRRPESQC